MFTSVQVKSIKRDCRINPSSSCTCLMNVLSNIRNIHHNTNNTSCELKQQTHLKNVYRKNLIIFDFDDTIFPTHSFRTKQYKKDKPFMFKLTVFTQLLEEIFRKMIQLYGAANIIILTNGKENWIQNCLNVDLVQPIFMNFQTILKVFKIKTISASKLEIRNKYPKNPYKWKQIAFTNIFEKYLPQNIKYSKRINCITSIGDSLDEYYASDIASVNINNRILNRIKFKSKPSIDDMIFQLKQILTMIVKFGTTIMDIDLDFSYEIGLTSLTDTTC